MNLLINCCFFFKAQVKDLLYIPPGTVQVQLLATLAHALCIKEEVDGNEQLAG